MTDRDLWTCPKCGNRFVTANMWHSCGTFDIDDLFANSDPNVRKAFDALAEMVQTLAEVTVIPQKTRIAFQTRTRFAGGTPKRKIFDASFIFFERKEHQRFYKIMDYSGKWFGHHVLLRGPEDVDDSVLAWLKEALRYGNQEDRQK